MNQSSFIALSSAVVVSSTVIADQTLLLIAIVVGFAGNSKVCCFFVKRQDLRKVPHFLFNNSAISSLDDYSKLQSRSESLEN